MICVPAIAELRQSLDLNQTELAKLAKMTQSEISKIERRDDHTISTLRRIVDAIGGRIEVHAVFKGKRVKLNGV